MTSTPSERATPSLTALERAVAALDEVAPSGGVGEVVDAFVAQSDVLTIRHASTLLGYPDWLWTVTLSTIDSEDPSVLEISLLPAETALVAPEWVPWADRLAEYLAQKETDADALSDADSDADDDDEQDSDLEDDLDDDFDDDFELESDDEDDEDDPDDADD